MFDRFNSIIISEFNSEPRIKAIFNLFYTYLIKHILQLECDFKKIIQIEKIINEKDVPAYEAIFQKDWPAVADGIIQLIKSSKIKEVIDFRKKYLDLINQGIFLYS